MTLARREVSTLADLAAAVGNPAVGDIVVTGTLVDVPTLHLACGQSLVGAGSEKARLRFASGQDGIRLARDNRVASLDLATDADRCAVFNDTSEPAMGRLVLQDLRVRGAVRILARDAVRAGHVEAHGVEILAADARLYGERPRGYGVEVVAGVFMLWNQQTDPAVTITADLTRLAAGRAGAPVLGSGIFVSGAGGAGGRLLVRRLETGEVHSDGGIAPGTPDRISGGVFVVHGAFVDSVRNHGPVTTYGPNDMVLDNWGMVDRWTAHAKVTSYGPSAIGFVNFGTVNVLDVEAPIETFGRGARGFNVYAGTVQSAVFDRVVTHADGAVGIQISQPVGSITVRRGIETHGGTGDSLVKGVVVQLAAIALSIKPGGSARKLEIQGGLATHGPGVPPLELHGAVEVFQVLGSLAAAGGGFDGI